MTPNPLRGVGLSSRYRFVSRFVLDAPPGEVFAAVLEPETWLPRLRHLRRLERLDDGGADGVGRTYATVVGATPYRLRWRMEAIEVVPDVLVAWDATGDLAGRGSWTLAAVEAGTLVTSRWAVETTPRWMRALTPVARPLFVRNHDRVMHAGARVLAEHLGARLVAFTSTDTRGRRAGGRRTAA